MQELTIRDWMVIIGAVMILAVLVDAARRVWQERRAEIRLNAKIGRADDDERDDEPFNLIAELPNGGARIVARDDLQPKATPLTAEELAVENSRSSEGGELIDPSGAGVGIAEEDDTAAVDPPGVHPAPHGSTTSDAPYRRGDKSTSGQSPADGPETLDWLDQLESPQPAPESLDVRLPRDADPHVFVLNVIARSPEGFSGSDILQILLACDLRFGDMDFFHRHESASGRGPIQFSVANMMNPGVFDIDAMDRLRTRGLMFFLTLPGPDNMLQAFDYMYETAKAVATNLDGDVLDETRSAITRQSLEHMRQQIRELERRLMVKRER